MRKPLIAGNWKMNTKLDEAINLVRDMLSDLDKIASVEKVLCPPFISLSVVKELIKGTTIQLGAQNMHFEDRGAYTGEIAPLMLLGLCQFVILGHSERRQYFAETDEIINKKVKKAVEFGLNPILCVGESLEDNEAGKTEQIITRQVKAGLLDTDPNKQTVIAYEPVWAIGTGLTATPQQAQEVHEFIRKLLAQMYNKQSADEMRILYGGSVKPDNAAELMEQQDVDGVLVGGASLKGDDFLSIIEAAI